MSSSSARTRPTGTIRRVVTAGLGTALVAAGFAAGPLPSAQAAFIVCAPTVNVFRWDGAANDPPGQVGDGVTWGDAYNWDQNCIPGTALAAARRRRDHPVDREAW